ncbi:MAG: coenzyme F420-0:L-glutamate ligase [Hyphomicrobiaceae bacterium]|nr:coenzyme F420-0:L-glutamate ligase [Hyphomicrobiaceae bacterium]
MQVTIAGLDGVPLVQPGDDVAGLIIDALERSRLVPQPKDILVVTQKIVSKAEGRYVDLASLDPSKKAVELAGVTRKDPSLVEAVLSQSTEVIRAKPGVLIVETRHGFVMANAGIDQSNLEMRDGSARILLLPEDPDHSARQIKQRIDARFSSDTGVIVSDSVGRAWRLGTVGLALGAAGVPALLDRRGEADLAGRRLEVTEVGFADAVAAAAVLVMGEAAEGRPAALVRGFEWSAPARPAAALLRPKAEDLFR